MISQIYNGQTLWVYRDITIVERHSSCSGSAEPAAQPQSSSSQSSSSTSGSYSQSEEEDQELEQYQEALYNLEQQRDAVRLRSPLFVVKQLDARGNWANEELLLMTPNLGTAYVFHLFGILNSQTFCVNPELCRLSCIGHARKPSIYRSSPL